MNFISDLTVTQKKYIVVSFLVLVLLSIYSMSKLEDEAQKVIIESKREDFKGGDIVSNRASGYYKSKDRLLSKQYDRVKSSQEILEKQLKDLQIALTKLQKEKVKDTPSDEEVSKEESQSDLLEKLKEAYVKKLVQQVPKQLSKVFHLEAQRARQSSQVRKV